MEEDDKGCPMIRMGVSGWVFLLVPAYPGCPGPKQIYFFLLINCYINRVFSLSICKQWYKWMVIFTFKQWHIEKNCQHSVNFCKAHNICAAGSITRYSVCQCVPFACCNSVQWVCCCELGRLEIDYCTDGATFSAYVSSWTQTWSCTKILEGSHSTQQ